jgi:gas vesicle protein
MSDNDSNTLKGIFVGMAIGFVAGAVTAMFLTTKTGEELRADIRKAAIDVKDKAEAQAGKIKNLSREKYGEIVDNILDGYNKVRDFTEKEMELIKKIVTEQKEVVSKK